MAKRRTDKPVKDALVLLDAAEHERREAMDNLAAELKARREELTPAQYGALLGEVKDSPQVRAIELAKALGISRKRLYQLIARGTQD